MTTTRITGNTTSYPELDALQKEFKRIYGPSFRDLPNRENTLLIFVQQGFENVAVQMDYILSLGIDKEHIFMTTKPQTTHEEMRQIFQFQVGYYERFAWKDVNIVLSNSGEDIAIDRTRSHYGQRAEVTCERLLERVGSFLNHNHGQKIQNILVMDEGGRFLSLFAEKYQEWQAEDQHFNIVSLEHTMSGTSEFTCSTLPFPCILMADCYLKTEVEAQYVADGVIEASKAVLEEMVDDDTVFGVIGCGNVGSHVIELLREEYPDKKILVTDKKSSVFTQIKINDLGWQDKVERVETNQEVFARAVLVFGCTGKDITEGLSRRQIAGNSQQTTLISASSGDREYLSLLINSPDYKFDSPEDFRNVSFEIEEADADSPKIIIHNGGFPVNFSPNRQYGIPLDKVGITLAMKYGAVAQAFELFSLFQLAQNHADPQKRSWLTRYMMLDPRLQQIILENFPLAEVPSLKRIIKDSKVDKPMTREKITGEVVFTDLLSNYYQGRGTIPLMFHEQSLPMDNAFIRLQLRSHVARQAHENYWPLTRLFETSDPQTQIQHVVIEGESGVGKTILSQFIGFACFHRDLYEQLGDAEEGAEEHKGEPPASEVPASPLLKEVNQWASLFKGVITVRLRDLNNFNFTLADPQYHLAEFILNQHNLQQNTKMGQDIMERAETLLRWLYENNEDEIKPRDHYLLVLDGYDELISGMYQNPSIEGHAVLRELLNYPYWILTSRPDQVDEDLLSSNVCQRHLVLDGFAYEDIEAYAKAVIPMLYDQRSPGRREVPVSEEIENFLEFIDSPSLKQLARLPICCQLLCCLWNEAQKRLESVELLTPALLYKEMVILLAKRARRRGAGTVSREIMRHDAVANYYQQAFSALAELAFTKQTGEQAGQLVILEDDLNRIVGIDSVRRIITQELHLLNPTHHILTQQQGFTTDPVEQYEFTHLSFQEFLAAIYLVKWLASDDPEKQATAITFVVENKYQQRHWNMVTFASSIVMEADCNLLWDGNEEHYQPRAKMAFWSAVFLEENDSREKLILLFDLWEHVGVRFRDLNQIGMNPFEALDACLVAMVNETFDELRIDATIAAGLSKIGKLPEPEFHQNFPRFISAIGDRLNFPSRLNERQAGICADIIASMGVTVFQAVPAWIEPFKTFLNNLDNSTAHPYTILPCFSVDLLSRNSELIEAVVRFVLRDRHGGFLQSFSNDHLSHWSLEFFQSNPCIEQAILASLSSENSPLARCNAARMFSGIRPSIIMQFGDDTKQAFINCLTDDKILAVRKSACIGLLLNSNHLDESEDYLNWLMQPEVFKGALMLFYFDNEIEEEFKSLIPPNAPSDLFYILFSRNDYVFQNMFAKRLMNLILLDTDMLKMFVYLIAKNQHGPREPLVLWKMIDWNTVLENPNAKQAIGFYLESLPDLAKHIVSLTIRQSEALHVLLKSLALSNDSVDDNTALGLLEAEFVGYVTGQEVVATCQVTNEEDGFEGEAEQELLSTLADTHQFNYSELEEKEEDEVLEEEKSDTEEATPLPQTQELLPAAAAAPPVAARTWRQYWGSWFGNRAPQAANPSSESTASESNHLTRV